MSAPSPAVPANPASKKRRNSNGGSDAIKVICRFRPPRAPAKEPIKSGKITYNPDSFKLNEETGDVNFTSDYQDGKHFTFDKVYGTESTQAQVFSEISGTVDFVMDGFNGAVLAYGQTSAGKSWTMEGPSIWDTEAQGVVPRCVDKLFEDIEKAPSNVQFQIVVSYYEIYCEKVRDLLNPLQTNMKVRETKTEGFIVQDVTEVYCTDKNSVLRVVEMGKTNRIAAPTLMNAESSRSHSIFSILVDQQDTASGRHKKGVLYLVDLAGSEKVGKTGAKGLRLEEAKNINGSLTSLGMVINALCDNAPHVPFRDSKLTMLLMEALGGNSKTTLIICCTPEHDHSPETLSTLRFGERAKRIKTNAKVNEELSAAELKVHLLNAKKELAALVSVLGRTSQSVGEAVATSSVTGLVPLVDVLKKCLSKAAKDRNSAEDSGVDDAPGEESGNPTPPAGDEDMLSVSAKQPVKSPAEVIADMQARLTSLEEEVELEKLKSEKEHENCVFQETEVAALQATIAELEEKLVKASLQAKRAQEAKAAAEEQLSAANAASTAASAAASTAASVAADIEAAASESTGDAGSAQDTTPLVKARNLSLAGHSGGVAAPLVADITPDKVSVQSPISTGSAEGRRELTGREGREFLIKLERELISTGTNFDVDGRLRTPKAGSDEQSPKGPRPLDSTDSAELMRFLNIHEGDLVKPAGMDAEGNAAYSKEAYESHVRRLMVILDQEQQARLRVEDKLEEARQQLIRQSAKIVAAGSTSGTKSKGFLQNLFGGGGSTSSSSAANVTSSTSTGMTTTAMLSSPLTSLSNMVADTISPAARRLSVTNSTAEENARRFNYSDRESALAETLEIAQERIMELVAEMESTQEAQMIVLETKESVLRSLARQNTHLAMERDGLNQKVDALTAKTEQLSALLRSVQQAQTQPIAPSSLPGPGLVSAQSFRIGGNGSLQRFASNARMLPGGGESELTGGTPKASTAGIRSAPSFRMGGKPPMSGTPSGTPSAVQGTESFFPAPQPSAAAASSPSLPPAVVPSPVAGAPLAGVGSLTARTPFLFTGGGTIQRNRSSAATSRSSPYPPSSSSPVNESSSTSLSSSAQSSYTDLTVLGGVSVDTLTSAPDTEKSVDSGAYSPMSQIRTESQDDTGAGNIAAAVVPEESVGIATEDA